MNWLLHNLTTDEFTNHLSTCQRVAAEKNIRYIPMAKSYRVPEPHPNPGERLYVRCDDLVVGYHEIIGTNRRYDPPQTFVHWQILCQPEFHRLDSCFPAPAARGLIPYNPPAP